MSELSKRRNKKEHFHGETLMLMAALRILWAAGMNGWIAAMFLITWLRPNTFGPLTVHHLTFVMLMEFIVVHASGFLGAMAARDEPRWRRAAMFAGLTAFYMIFAAGFAAMYGGWWPLWAFWGLLSSRFPTVVLRPPDLRGQAVLIVNWAAMMVLYLGGIFLTAIISIPPLGVTAAVIEAQHFKDKGLWPEEPYRVMAFGALYFSGLTLLAIVNEALAVRSARKQVFQESLRKAGARQDS
jgi:hypothetical protein